jgi:hypothetical protein
MADKKLSRDDFFSDRAITLDLSPLDIPELGGTVYVKAMSGKERDAYESWALSERGVRNIRGKAAARCLCDEKGARLFSDQDAGRLGDIKVSILQKVFIEFQRLSGLTKDDIDELEQGSGAAEAGAGSSSS